ncbi:MAG: hypothetical protein H5T85_04425 [Actinobacteria bacterium]|jgi:hypothetical protein|nr:hypothetical protein [Actinomycetota bacterium]
MKKIKIKNKDLLIRIFKTISWLDTRRWNIEDNYNFVNFFGDDLTNCEKILTHWICYIADRQMPFEIVWDKGGFVFSELVYEYSRNKDMSPDKILKEHYEKYQDKDKDKERFRFKSKTSDVTFASRYVTDDYQNILQTLEILDKYEISINGKKYKRNIVAFVLHFIQRFEGKDDLLIRVACALHLSTYQLDGKKANPKEVIEILNSDEKFEEKLKEFKRTSTNGKKRLWCCIRDYKKGLYHEIFKNAIKEVVSNYNANKLINVWSKLPMNQIELPGDVWNNSPLFKNNLFADVLDLDSIPKTWTMPKIVRDVYEQLENDDEVKNFYPEQFDITFDFVPRMCNKKLCNVCLFGEKGVELICIPTKDKYCPVALLSCGYIAKCEGESCIIRMGISKGICKGGLK